jgi:hypothetical protein
MAPIGCFASFIWKNTMLSQKSEPLLPSPVKSHGPLEKFRLEFFKKWGRKEIILYNRAFPKTRLVLGKAPEKAV